MEIDIDNLPDGIKHALAHLIGIKCEEDYTKWPQVGKLSGDLLTAWKTFKAHNANRRRELKAIVMKAKALDALCDAEKADIWHRIESGLSLPAERNFHIEDDGRVLMEPNEH